MPWYPFSGFTLMQQQLSLASSSSANEYSSSSAEPWLMEFADFSCCYLMGDSSGGNLVHHLSLQVAGLDMTPLRIRAQIIAQPFFGGQMRTATELRLANDELSPLHGLDGLWRTALPEGADRDHPLANPLGPLSPDYKKLSHKLPSTLLMVATGDIMHERQLQLFHKLKEAGVEARLVSYEGSHGFRSQGGPNAETFINDVVDFLLSLRACSSKL